MKKEVKNIPTLRFPGSSERWGTESLGQLLTFKNGINAEKGRYGKGTKFINVLDIINNRYIIYDNIIGSVEVTEKEFEKNKVIYGDILFQRSSETREEVGQANVYLDNEKNAVFGGFVIRGRKKSDYHPTFMNYLLKTWLARKEITTKSGGSTRYNVGQDTLSKVEVFTPPLPEQQKIASFLAAVDKKIEQLTRKKELLEQYKKGVMQKIFSQEIRFKDDNGQDYPDWEEKSLREITVKIGSGLTPRGGEKTYRDEGILFIRSQNVNENRLLLQDVTFIPEETHGQMKNSEVRALDILLNITGASIGRSCVVPKNFITGNVNQHVCIIRLEQGYSPYFYQAFIGSFNGQKLVFQCQAGGGREGLNFQNIRNFNISAPVFGEQQKIANFLSSINDKIIALQTQLTQNQKFKKGLLQKMFV